MQTVKAYRDTYTLFLPFAAEYHSVKIKSLSVDHLIPEVILAFSDYLESDRNNSAKTRNLRLATIKSLAKMIRFMYPEQRDIAERILNIPQKRTRKQLIGFLYPDEILEVFEAVDLTRREGFRDYTILHLLYDSGARASEIASLKIEYFDPENKTLVVLGKGNRYRHMELWPRTTELMKGYITKYRITPKPLYQHRLFINQRGEELTRHGIYRICKKYLFKVFSSKRLKDINPAHSFRHSCAVRMLSSGDPISDIKNRLGHENIQSTMAYLQMDITSKRQVQQKFIEYTRSVLKHDTKIDELVAWEHKEETLTWLDSL